MTSNKIKAGSKVVMNHSQRQAFLKNSSLGQLFGIAHLLPESEDTSSNDNALKFQEKFVEVKYTSEDTLHYRVLEPSKKSGRRWFSRVTIPDGNKTVSLIWMQLYSKVDKLALPINSH